MTAKWCAGTGKTQVALRVKIAIPRMEFVAAVNSVRLAKKVRESLKIPLAGTVLGMRRAESGRFTKSIGANVSEVKVNNNVEGEWL